MTLETILKAPAVTPVVVGFLDIKDDPVYGWTGNGVFAPTGTGDPDLDGNLFAPAESAVDITDFVENMANGEGVTLTFSAPDTDADVIKQVVRDRRVWQLRRMKLWLFFQDTDEKTILPFYRQVFGGYIVSAKTSRKPGEPGAIIIEGDADLALAAGAPARLVDHARFNAGDTWSSWILDLVNGLIAGTNNILTNGRAATGGAAGRSRGTGGPKYSYDR